MRSGKRGQHSQEPRFQVSGGFGRRNVQCRPFFPPLTLSRGRSRQRHLRFVDGSGASCRIGNPIQTPLGLKPLSLISEGAVVCEVNESFA